MTADVEALASQSTPAATTWPLLQKGIARSKRMQSTRLRRFMQSALLRLALAWLSFAIALAAWKAVAGFTARRYFRNSSM
jgi:hypothetical protein